ncbi:MAG: choice-of-anchor J domain-containing protein, partial [candidate division WOR-3 bacterium]
MSKTKILSLVLIALVSTLGAQLLEEGFEGTTFPPTGWVVYNADGGGYQWERYTTNPRTGVACAASRWESSTLQNNDWLVTPQIAIPAAGATLRFWYRAGSTTYYEQLVIRLSTNTNQISDFTVVLDSMSFNQTSYLEKVISLNAYANQNVYIAFVNRGLDMLRVYIDDVLVEGNFTNDVGVSAILAPQTNHLVGAPLVVRAKVVNPGFNDQGNFAVRCTIFNTSGTVRFTDERVISLASGRDTTIEFNTWTPTVVEECSVVVRTVLAGDENPTNDRKSSYTSIGPFVIVGTGTSTSSLYPIYCYYNYSVSEAIYLQREIGYRGEITSLAYYKGSGTNTDPIQNVSIYLKHTPDSVVSSGSWDYSGYTLVYQGDFPNDVNDWVEVPLTTPFLYNNQDNLAVLVVKDNYQVASGYPSYRYSTTVGYKNRYGYSSSALPTSLTATTARPNIRFGMNYQPPPANDVGVKEILYPQAFHYINRPIVPKAIIKNYGTADQSNFAVVCSIIGSSSGLLYHNTQIVPELAADRETTITFDSYQPVVQENLTTVVRTLLDGDEYAANDRRTVSTELTPYIYIGTGTSSSPYQPWYRWYNYSTHEVIYLKSEIDIYGEITHIAWNKASGTNLDSIENVSIYMKEAPDSTLTTGDYSLDGYELVYQGKVANNQESGWMEVTLTTPFLYTNSENLHILVVKGYQQWISGYPSYYYTTTPVNRSRYAYNDNYQPTTLSATTMRPNIRLQITPVTPPNIDVAVTNIVLPPAEINLRTTSSVPVAAKLKNYASNPTGNFAVRCTIYRNGPIYTDEEILSLAGNETLTVSFDNWNATPGVCTVVVRAFLTGDERPENDAQSKIATAMAGWTGGPDAGNMRWIDSDTLTGPVYNWIDISSTGNDLTLAYGSWDDGYGKIPIGFSFTFYDNTYDTVYVNTNGFLSFGAGSTVYSNDSIPTSAAPNNAIYALWDDLHCLADGRVKYQTLGTSPNCTLVVSYNNVRFYGGGDSTLTFQVLLCQGSNDIIIQYADVTTGYATGDGGRSATVGIENNDGSTGLRYLYNGSPSCNILVAGRAIRFYYRPLDNDVGVLEITSPQRLHPTGISMTPKARIKNFGLVDQSNFAVVCSIIGDDNGLLYQNTQYISLASGRDTIVQFASWVPTTEESCLVKVATALDGDQRTANDLKTLRISLQYVVDVSVNEITVPHNTESKRVAFAPQAVISNNGSEEVVAPVICEIYGLPAPMGKTSTTESAKPMAKAEVLANSSPSSVETQKSPGIRYRVVREITCPSGWSTLGVTPVWDTLIWISASNAGGGNNKIFIYNTKTNQWVDSFAQNTSGWGYRDLCFYNGYVYAGREGYIAQIDPNPPYNKVEYAVSGIGCVRALTDNNVEDSLWTANWASDIYKFYHLGGAVRSVATNAFSIYGLAYDPVRNCVWGSSQSSADSQIVKYSYPDFTVLEYGAFPEMTSSGRIAGGCEMWGDNYLLYVGQSDKIYVLGLPVLLYRDSVAVTVGAGKATAVANFAPVNINTYQDCYVKVYTTLAGDMIAENNSLEKTFTVEPLPITLISPPNGVTMSDNTPTFSWSEVTGAEIYRIEVDSNPNFTDPVFAGELGDTEIESDPLPDGTYYWRVRVQSPGTPDPWSEVRTFTIYTAPAGWTRKADIPHPADLKEGKFVKDGGALVAAGNVLYAFPGNKSSRFFKYTPGSGWTVVESIPY